MSIRFCTIFALLISIGSLSNDSVFAQDDQQAPLVDLGDGNSTTNNDRNIIRAVPSRVEFNEIDSAMTQQGISEDYFVPVRGGGFDDFISPMTNPVFFEDPRTVTEARFIFLNHQIPLLPGTTTSTDAIQLYALQLRFAITDRLSLIATKDGFVVSDSPLIDDGWADVAAGLKYNLIRDEANRRLLSAGLTFELPVGSQRTLQGNGDGEFNLFMTGMRAIGSRGHWISAAGFRIPSDSRAESQSSYWSNHLDIQLSDNFYVFTELNWFHWWKSGQAFGLPVEGFDFFNLGAVGVAGNDILTSAIGMKFKPDAGTEIGVAFEVPLTERRDVMENRLTLDWIMRF